MGGSRETLRAPTKTEAGEMATWYPRIGLFLAIILLSSACSGPAMSRTGVLTRSPVAPDLVPLDPPDNTYWPGTIVRKTSADQRFVSRRCPGVVPDTAKTSIYSTSGELESKPLGVLFGQDADPLFQAEASRTVTFTRAISGEQHLTTTDGDVRECLADFRSRPPPEEGAYYLVREVITARAVTFRFYDAGLRKVELGVPIPGRDVRFESTSTWFSQDTLVREYDEPMVVYIKEELIRGRPGRLELVVRSALIPGWGQLEKGTPRAGAVAFWGAFLGAMGWFVLKDARSDRLGAAESSRVQSDHDRLISEANRIGRAQNVSALVGLASWAFGIGDAAFGRIRIR